MFSTHHRYTKFIFSAIFISVTLACSLVTSTLPEQVNNTPAESTPSSVAPTATQKAAYTSFNKDGLALQYPVDLFKSIQSTSVQAVVDSPIPLPAYTQFDPIGYPLKTNDAPFIMLFSAEEYGRVSPGGMETVNDLKNMKPGDNLENMAFPNVIYARMLFSEHRHMVEFKNGKGYAQITQYAQDVTPITNASLVYAFTGVTNNGALLVAFFPINAPGLPQSFADVKTDEWKNNYTGYLDGIKQQLHSIQPGDFTPNLDVLDNVMASFNAAAPVVSAPFTCPKAPDTQLKVGDKAKVIQSTTRLRSKPEVNDSNILFVLGEGDELKIIDGPTCTPRPGRNDFYIFWKVSVPSRSLEGWVAEGDSDYYYIAPFR